LKDFERDKKFKVDFDSIDLDFLYKYIDYLEHSLKLKSTTIAKDIRL